jgi:hypothetical protein
MVIQSHTCVLRATLINYLMPHKLSVLLEGVLLNNSIHIITPVSSRFRQAKGPWWMEGMIFDLLYNIFHYSQ